MLEMYSFRAGSVSDLVQNDFGDLDLRTGCEVIPIVIGSVYAGLLGSDPIAKA